MTAPKVSFSYRVSIESPDGTISNYSEQTMLSYYQAANKNYSINFASEEDALAAIEGYKADIALLNTDLPQFYPRNNYIAALCYSANGSEVETVISNGEILMENKEFKTLDKEKIYFECQKTIERIK